MFGAVLLAGEAALRCGSGMVSIASTAAHLDFAALRIPELLSIDALADSADAVLARADALVLGPGLGQSEWGTAVFSRFFVSRALKLPVVVDADGLNLLAKMPIPPPPNPNCVLTPHAAEAGRLLGRSAKAVQADRAGAAQQIVARYGGVCVLKGAATLVCSADRLYYCDAGNPGMASAGMGDVLAGVIGALLAQGIDATDAACTGVWLHSNVADVAAQRLGERGLIATDVINGLAAGCAECENSSSTSAVPKFNP